MSLVRAPIQSARDYCMDQLFYECSDLSLHRILAHISTPLYVAWYFNADFKQLNA